MIGAELLSHQIVVSAMAEEAAEGFLGLHHAERRREVPSSAAAAAAACLRPPGEDLQICRRHWRMERDELRRRRRRRRAG